MVVSVRSGLCTCMQILESKDCWCLPADVSDLILPTYLVMTHAGWKRCVHIVNRLEVIHDLPIIDLAPP